MSPTVHSGSFLRFANCIRVIQANFVSIGFGYSASNFFSGKPSISGIAIAIHPFRRGVASHDLHMKRLYLKSFG